jgi:hypothetical protein
LSNPSRGMLRSSNMLERDGGKPLLKRIPKY